MALSPVHDADKADIDRNCGGHGLVGGDLGCGEAIVVKLSICIPTFERWPFLAWTLGKLSHDFPNAEIIVSDNCSSPCDTLPCPDWGAARWIWQDTNIGPFPNMLAALSGATGQYAVYCADDDYLLSERVTAAIEYLDAHPAVAAYCAPCEIWNEVNQKPYWNAWTATECTFGASDKIDLFNFLIERHIWPEHLIYRLPLPLKPRTRAYWAFVDLADVLEAGAIHFSPEPFYRNLLNHPVGAREQLGNVQCLTYFDEYRAGLEVLAYRLFGSLAHPARRRIQDMIASFICTRMAVATQLYDRNPAHSAESQMLRARLAIADPRPDRV